MIYSECPECKSNLKTDLLDIITQECSSCSWEGDYIDSENLFKKGSIDLGYTKIKQKNDTLLMLSCMWANNNTGSSAYWIGTIMTGMKMIYINNNEVIVGPSSQMKYKNG